MSHSASRVAGTNRTQVPIVPAVPPLLPSLSKTALLSLLPSVLISSRTHRRRAAAAGKPQAAVDYGLVRSDPTPSTVSRPAPTARKPRPSWSVSPSQVSRGPSINSVPPMPIQHATDAINPAPPLLGALRPEAPRHVSTPAALPEMPSPSEVEFIECVERYSHTDWAHEQRAKPVRDAAIRYVILRSPSVLPDDLLVHLAPHKRRPLSEVCSLAEKGRPYTDDDDDILLFERKLTPPTPICPDKPGGRAVRLLDDEPTPRCPCVRGLSKHAMLTPPAISVSLVRSPCSNAFIGRLA